MTARPRATPETPYHNPASGWTFHYVDGVREMAEKMMTPPGYETKEVDDDAER